jgi:hypothetical protein
MWAQVARSEPGKETLAAVICLCNNSGLERPPLFWASLEIHIAEIIAELKFDV